MNRSQRIVLVLYCLLIVCCCVWVPWRVVVPGDPPVRIGYAWLSSGPPGYDPMVGSPDFPSSDWNFSVSESSPGHFGQQDANKTLTPLVGRAPSLGILDLLDRPLFEVLLAN
jgi:hypothetical protein